MIKYKRSPIFYMGNKYKLLKDLLVEATQIMTKFTSVIT